MSFTASISRMSTLERLPGSARSLDLRYLIRLRAIRDLPSSSPSAATRAIKGAELAQRCLCVKCRSHSVASLMIASEWLSTEVEGIELVEPTFLNPN
jgi:hypothetical protein